MNLGELFQPYPLLGLPPGLAQTSHDNSSLHLFQEVPTTVDMGKQNRNFLDRSLALAGSVAELVFLHFVSAFFGLRCQG